MPTNEPKIDPSKVQWDSQPQIDPSKVVWDGDKKKVPTSSQDLLTPQEPLTPPLSAPTNPVEDLSPTSLIKQFGGASEPKGNPPFAVPSLTSEQLKSQVESSVKKIHNDNGYDWQRPADVIGHVEGDVKAPVSMDDIHWFLEGIRHDNETNSHLDPITKVAVNSYLNSAEGLAQGVHEVANAKVGSEVKNIWQAFELPAALVKTAFSGASLALPELQAFNASLAAGEKVLPSDLIGYAMSPIQTLRSKGGIVAVPMGGVTKVFNFGQEGDKAKAAAELGDLVYQILVFHGAKELAGKVIHNEALTPIEQKEVNRLVDEGLKDATPLDPEAIKKVPEDLPDEKKAQVVPLIAEKQTAETQKQNLQSEKSKLDPAFHEAKDKEIADQEKKIETKDTEIKKIIAEPEKEVVEKPKHEVIDDYLNELSGIKDKEAAIEKQVKSKEITLNEWKKASDDLLKEHHAIDRKYDDLLGGDRMGQSGDKKAKTLYHFTGMGALEDILGENKISGEGKEGGEYGGVSMTTDPNLDARNIPLEYGNVDAKTQTTGDAPIRIDFNKQKLKDDGYKVVLGNDNMGTFANEQEMRIFKLKEGEKPADVEFTDVPDVKKYIDNVQINPKLLSEKEFADLKTKLDAEKIPYTIKEAPKSELVETKTPLVEEVTGSNVEGGKLRESVDMGGDGSAIVRESISSQREKHPTQKGVTNDIPYSEFTLHSDKVMKGGEEKTFEFTKRIKTDEGGVNGVVPLNQFKLNQGNNKYGEPYPKVHIILDDVDALKYQDSFTNSQGKKIYRNTDFRNSINEIAKRNRDKSDEVVLDFRKTEIENKKASENVIPPESPTTKTLPTKSENRPTESKPSEPPKAETKKEKEVVGEQVDVKGELTDEILNSPEKFDAALQGRALDAEHRAIKLFDGREVIFKHNEKTGKFVAENKAFGAGKTLEEFPEYYRESLLKSKARSETQQPSEVQIKNPIQAETEVSANKGEAKAVSKQVTAKLDNAYKFFDTGDYQTLKKKNVTVEFGLEELANGDEALFINDIATDPAHQGKAHASAVLQEITNYADNHDMPVALRASIGGHNESPTQLNQQQLIKWYEKRGFELRPEESKFGKDDIFMVREPKSEKPIQPIETEVSASKGDKVFKKVTDEDGTVWEAVSTNKSGVGKFDIYRDGEKQNVGAAKVTDIDGIIDSLRDSQKNVDAFEGNLNWEKTGKNGKTERTNDFKDYTVEVTRKFDSLNKPIGANLTISKRNADGTLTIVKQKSDYKTIPEAKRDALSQVKELSETTPPKKEISASKEAPKTFTEKGKQLADKIRKLKSKPLELKDENGNVIKIEQAGFDLNPIIDAIADAVEKGGEVLDAIKTELEKVKWYQNLTDKGKEAVVEQMRDRFENPPDVGERKFGKQMLKSDEVLPEVKAEVQKNIEYIRRKNALTVKEAGDLISKVGEEEAFNLVTNDRDIHPATRVVMGEVLIKKFGELAKNAKDEDAKNYYLDKAIDTANFVMEKLGTEAGQSIQAFSLFSRLSPEAQLRAAQKEKAGIAKNKINKRKKDIDKIGDRFQDANKEAISEVLESKPIKEQILKSKKSTEEKISKIRDDRKKIREKYRKNKGGILSANGLTKEGIEFMAEMAVSYVKEGVVLTKDLVDRMIDELKDMVGESAVSDTLKQKIQYIAQDVLGKEGERLVKGGLAEMEIDLKKLVEDHYTKVDQTKKSLVDKIKANLPLDKVEAQAIAQRVERAFNDIATRKKRAILEADKKRFDRVQEKLKGGIKTEPKALQDEIIRWSNLGAFDNAQLADVIAKKLGTDRLTPEQANEIMRLANRVQEAPEGSPKREATEDLLAYRAKIAGTSVGEVAQAVWYASILSGHQTQEKNFVSNFFNALGAFGVEAASNPKSIPYLLSGFTKGVIRRGAPEALHTLTTGRSPIHISKIETPSSLERIRFKGGKFNPANYAKYVMRVMTSADVLSFQGLKEMRATQLALSEANKLGYKTTSKAAWHKVNEILLNTKDRFDTATEQVKSEGLTGQKAKRRTWELMEDNRPQDMVDDSYGFAAKGTFNHETEGTLGAVTDAFAKTLDIQIGGARPLRFVVPFTRIITNVANNALDFSIVGAGRAIRGKRGFEGMGDKYKVLSKEERLRLAKKAAIGISATAALSAMAQAGVIQITGGGTGNYKKDEQLRQSGWQPYSIKIGDKFYSYQYTPLILNLGIMGNLFDHNKYGLHSDEETALQKTQLAVWQGMNMLANMTWVGSTAGVLSAFTESTPEPAVNKVLTQGGNIAKGAVIPNLYTQFARTMEQINGASSKETQGLYDKMIQDVPIARNSLNDRLNALGEPIKVDADIFVSSTIPNKYWDYLNKKGAWVSAPNEHTVIVFDNKTNQDRPVTDDEYHDLIALRGKKIKEKLDGLFENGASIKISKTERTHKTAEEMTKAQLQDWLESASRQATIDAKEEMFKPKLSGEGGEGEGSEGSEVPQESEAVPIEQ